MAKSRGIPRTSVRLADSVREALKEICERDGISVSDAIRIAISEFIESRKTKTQ